MNSHFCRLILFVGIFLIVVPHAHARRTIPDDNLAYPILLTLKTSNSRSVGSGFYLSTATTTYLVTAKHVLAAGLASPDAELELLSYSKDLPIQKRIFIVVNLAALRAAGNVRLHQSQDVAVIKLGTFNQTGAQVTTTFQPGVTVRESADSGIVSVGMDTVRTFDQVLVGNDALLYGYPVSLGIRESPQFDPLRPLLRKALVAGQDPQKRSIIIDGPVYRGNSGGPAFQIEQEGFGFRYSLIGVVVEFVPLTERAEDFTLTLNSGYSIVKPMDFVLELTKE
jgi:S1-C subfamily serine protease